MSFYFSRSLESLMLVESSPNRLTIKKGGVTMHAPTRNISERLSALEAYVDMPEGHNGVAITSRLKAQHDLLLAFRAEFTDFRAETNRRLTELEDGMGKALHGITAIKNLLTSSTD